MKKFFVYPYRYECDNAIMLKNRLDGQRIKLEGSVYKHDAGNHVVINWGNSKCPYSGKAVVNQPFNVSLAVNKSVTFDVLRNAGVPTVEITRYKPLALQWIKDGHSVVGRKLLSSNNGKGIFFLEDNPEEDAKLYTKYIPDADEYRVNVYRGELISIRGKVKDGEPNKIRSGVNGYFFKDVQINQLVKDKLIAWASAAIAALGLDFGGVDILYSGDGDFHILEVNTAPELQGKAMDKLAEFIKRDFA